VNNVCNCKFSDLIRDLNYFSFSHPNPNPNPTYLPKHEFLSPNNQFYQRIWYVEFCACVHDAKSEISQVRNFAWHRNQSNAHCSPPLWRELQNF